MKFLFLHPLKAVKIIQFQNMSTNLLVVFLREELTVALTLITNLILMLKLSNQTQSNKMAGLFFLDCGPHWIKHMLFPERFVAPLFQLSISSCHLEVEIGTTRWREKYLQRSFFINRILPKLFIKKVFRV